MHENFHPEILVPPRDAVKPAFECANVPLFLGCDDRFFMHAVTVVASVLEHATPENNYDVIIAQTGVPKAKLARAAAWAERFPNARLRFVDMTGMIERYGVKDLNTTAAWSTAVYFPILAPETFREYDRILYLDSDLLVFADVADLYRTDLAGKSMAVCHDFPWELNQARDPEQMRWWREDFGMDIGDVIFNSGVMVMDLARMRRLEAVKKVLEMARRMKAPKRADQDVLNAAFRNDVVFLSSEWNYHNWMTDPSEKSFFFDYMDEPALAEIRAKRDRVKILHLTEKKPWSLGYEGQNDDLYWRYAAKTPFHREIMDELGRECTTARYLVLTMQGWNFGLRAALAKDDKKKKYTKKHRTVEYRKRNILAYRRRRGELKGQTPPDAPTQERSRKE